MTDAPSWLSPDEGGAAAPAPATNATESFEISGNDGGAAAPAASTTSSPDDADLPGVILMMRLANMGVAASLMACSVSNNETNSVGGCPCFVSCITLTHMYLHSLYIYRFYS